MEAAVTPHERNPTLHGPLEFDDYLTCRSCGRCLIVLRSEQPGILMRDLGICDIDDAPVDPDEKRTIDELECWKAREL